MRRYSEELLFFVTISLGAAIIVAIAPCCLAAIAVLALAVIRAQ